MGGCSEKYYESISCICRFHNKSSNADSNKMSVNDLQKTIDALVEVVAKKNKDLDALKRDYDDKLHIINQYIDRLKETFEDADDSIQNTDSEALGQSLQNLTNCPKCDFPLLTFDGSDEFILLPKHRLRYLLKDSAGGLADAGEKESRTEEHVVKRRTDSSEYRHRNDIPKNSSAPKPFSEKSKRVCSYCRRHGHSRAKCIERLSRPLKE